MGKLKQNEIRLLYYIINYELYIINQMIVLWVLIRILEIRENDVPKYVWRFIKGKIIMVMKIN